MTSITAEILPLKRPPPIALPASAVEVRGLVKTYRRTAKTPEKRALDGIDLAIPRGSIFGLLGPNGAGKSTLINILAGLVIKTAGVVRVWDIDIDTAPRAARAAIGVVPQELTFDMFFTPREHLELQAGFYGVPARERRTMQILEMVGLTAQADSLTRTLSGGMRRRLMVAKAMVHAPPVLVLDEPTAGVDVELRRHLWDQVRALNRAGTTILLTTHYLEEAESLCDRIAIIDEGRVVACDTTAELVARVDDKRLIIALAEPISTVPERLAALGLSVPEAGKLVMRYNPSRAAIGLVLDAIRAAGLHIRDVTSEQADLEDIFLRLTGGSEAVRILAVIGLATLLGACAGQPTGSAPGMGAVTPGMSGDAFTMDDGARLPLRSWLPAGKPRAVIVALHGFNDYSNAFAAPGAQWAKHGIATFAYDQRGFGRAPARGDWAGTWRLDTDLAEASRLVRASYPGVPLYVLGESMGGAVVITAVAGSAGAPRPVCDGIILAAPAVWGRPTMSAFERVALWTGDMLFPGLKLTGRGLNIVPSDNVAMLRALSRDPLVIKETRVDTLRGLVDLMDMALAAAPHLANVPMLLLYGQHDEIVPKMPTRLFIAELARRERNDSRIAWYEHGYHMLLRDLDADIVIGDVATWVEDTHAALPSGADRRAHDGFWAGSKG